MHEESQHFIDGLILWYTDRVSTVEIIQSPRIHGSSGWKLNSLIRAGIDMVTNYSRSPLLLTTWISFSASFIGFFLGLGYIFFSIFSGTDVPGWTSIFVSISFFSSVQLLSLGMMGEYISRLQINSNRKPRYLIREVFEN